jgi:RNA polymerase sigma factor (sigma-70 family)
MSPARFQSAEGSSQSNYSQNLELEEKVALHHDAASVEPNVAAGGSGPNRFTTTRWSLVLSSANGGDSDATAQEALAQLCQIYWRPIFAFICRRGNQVSDAQDLTQDFFVLVLRGDLLQRADPERGRFRSLLLKALQNFLIDAHEKRSAIKRGGEMKFVSWDDWMAEAPSHLSLPAQSLESWPPERLFDVRWAATVVEQALRRLREECEARGRRRVFDALSGLLSAEREDVSYETVAKTLGVPPPTVKRLVHQMRRRYRELLREEVAATVATPDEVEEELRYLCAALSVQNP